MAKNKLSSVLGPSAKIGKGMKLSLASEKAINDMYFSTDFYKIIPLGKTSFFLKVKGEQEPRAVGTRTDIGYDTSMFKFQPISNIDDSTVVNGWVIRPKFVAPLSEVNHGDRFLFSARRKAPDAAFAPIDAVSNAQSSVEDCQKAMTQVYKSGKLPIPKVVAMLHGLVVLECGDAAGLVIVNNIPDFSL